MSNDSRVVEAYNIAADTAIRFDYFVTGGAGAVLTVLLKDITPNGAGPVLLYQVALVSVALSVSAGLVHLYADRFAKQLTVQLHQWDDEIIALRGIVRGNKAGVLKRTGDVISPTDAEKLISELRTLEQKAKRKRNFEYWKGRWSGRIRNVALLVGFGGLVLWRLLST